MWSTQSAGVNSSATMASRTLIVAYGNPLRSDDGIAWHAVEMLRGQLSPPAIEILCAHQLTPEIAEAASRADSLIFIDAARGGEPGQIAVSEIGSSKEPAGLSHQLAPEHVVALCRQLYGASPRAFTVSIAGESFEHGEALSPALQAALPRLFAAVQVLIERLNSSHSPFQQT